MTVRTVIHSMIYLMRDHADMATKQPLIGNIRQLIQKVVINRTAGREPAALEVHGRIASILAAMQTAQMMEAKFTAMVDQDLMARQMSGEIDMEQKRKSSGFRPDTSPKTAKASLAGGVVICICICALIWLRGPDWTETCKVFTSSLPCIGNLGHKWLLCTAISPVERAASGRAAYDHETAVVQRTRLRS